MAMPSTKKLYVWHEYNTINYLKIFRLLKIKLLDNCFYFINYLFNILF